MKLGTEDKKKLTIAIVVGVFALGAVFYLYSELFAGSSAPVAAPVATTVAGPSSAGATSAKAVTPSLPPGYVVGAKGSSFAGASLDPTLKMGPMLVTEALVYSGTGRNIFSPNSAPVLASIPKPIAPARPKGNQAAVTLQPQGPPPPPPIELKFFGTATSGNGHRQAFLLHGDDVFLASDGDIVQRRYKIISVAASSIVVEDMVNSNRQTLPLLTN